nr:hypothetical protein [Tanacetum cinerariifolium]
MCDDARKKVKAPPKKTLRKTGIWSGRKADSPKRNVVFSPEKKIHYFDREDIKEVEHENAYSKKKIIVLSNCSDNTRKMSKKEPLITRKPVEGPPIELLKWYGYDTYLYQGDEFSSTDNDTTDNASSDEDTIQKSQSPNSEGKYVPVCQKRNTKVKSPIPITGCVLGVANM